MEAALLHWSADHESMPSYNKARNPKRNNKQTRSLIPSRTNSTAGNLYYSESLPKMGVFLNPLSSSLPRLNSSPYPLQHPQPPLLPLPMPSRQFRSLPPSGAATQLSPTHKKQNKGNKNQTNPKQGTKSVNNNRVGRPNPESLPKKQVKFSGSVFPEAPPPSSLPMPNFSLKPKMSCRVEASTGSGGGVRVDSASSTTNLCRLLNLR